MTSIGLEVKKLEPLYIARKKVKWCKLCGNSLTVPPKSQHRITRWLSNSTPRCIHKRTENRKFWSMTETQEVPQLTSTPAHTKLTATTQSHWKKSSNELSQCYRLGKQENTHIGEGLGTPSSHEEQRRRLGQLQGFETQPRLRRVGQQGSSPIHHHMFKTGRRCYLI